MVAGMLTLLGFLVGVVYFFPTISAVGKKNGKTRPRAIVMIIAFAVCIVGFINVEPD